MYSVFIRNHIEEGTFSALEKDLDRIKSLGVDIIWLLPVHPIGKVRRKGKEGCPYAISDYRAVNPEYGTMENFRHLVDAIHRRNMKCIMDVVYNHTSPDSVLCKEHPEWFYRNCDGNFGNKVGDWTDVIDLDYNKQDLWDYQIETIKMWAAIVDGFRCDVASLVPLEFWIKIREQVEKVHPGSIWISESISPEFLLKCREMGIESLSDSEVFQAFDVSYEYDVYHWFTGYLSGEISLSQYAQKLNEQEYIYTDNYVKLRFLENHDKPRAHYLIQNESSLKSWLAFLYFQKGMTLLYAGQEYGVSILPSLFDVHTVNWAANPDLSGMTSKLYNIKKHPLMRHSSYKVWDAGEDVLCAQHRDKGKKLLGIFPLSGNFFSVEVPIEDGSYINMIDGEIVTVLRGVISHSGKPIIIEP